MLPRQSWPGVAGQTTATETSRNSLAVLWLGLHALTTKDLGSVPHRGTEIPQAVAWSQRRPPEPPGKPRGGGQGAGGEVAVVTCRRGSRTRSSCPRRRTEKNSELSPVYGTILKGAFSFLAPSRTISRPTFHLDPAPCTLSL